ncbi:MAG: glycosyltransferase family 39 protein [Xenococcaceae cyanobacterium MO_188.B32]|nr:glycosyltransferase family 39 protein [Xenococcaceae cyanobacterium MO_188.B32]
MLRWKRFTYLSLILLIVGVLVRLRLYFSNRSLWFDEASLAINIVDRSYAELLKPLDYNQAAPPLFLWLEKFFVQLLGNNEYALRLFPLVSGIIALGLFYKLAVRFTSGLATPMAIALFASLKYTVYYSVEAKPYASDLMVALVLFLLLRAHSRPTLPSKNIIFLSLIGSVSIWLSYPSIFILFGLELFFLLHSPFSKLSKIVLNRLPIYTSWLLSFVGLYVATIVPTMTNDNLVSSWNRRYPDSPFDIIWLLDSLGRFFHKPLGFWSITDGIAIIAFIAGCIALYRQDKFNLLLLNTPILVTIVAAYLHKYPFRGRLILFLAPFAIIIVAEGMVFLLNQFRYRYLFLIGCVVAISLLSPPLILSGQALIHPSQFDFDHIRPAIEYIKSNQQPEDIIYVFPRAQRQFVYYASKYNLSPAKYILGTEKLPDKDNPNRKQYLKEISQLKRKQRIWFLLSRTQLFQEEGFLKDLEYIGQPLEVFRQPDTMTCLYDIASK